MANETKKQGLIRTREQRWANGFYTFEDARAYLKESGKNKSLPIVLFVLALIDIAAILSFFFIEKQPLFLLAGIPYLLFLIIISFKGINNSFGALIGFAFVGFFVSGFIVGGVMSAMLKLDVSFIRPLFPGIVAACITFTTFLWGCHRCFTDLFSLSAYKKQKSFFASLLSQKGTLTEQEFDLQVLAKVEQYNNVLIAEEKYQTALAYSSIQIRLENMKAAAKMGHQKAKDFLAAYDAFILLTKAEEPDYKAMFAYMKNADLQSVVENYLKTCPVGEKCSIEDAIQLRDLGNTNAEEKLATVGDLAYKLYKESGADDQKQLEYIIGTLRSPIASIEGAIITYREAITEELTKDEKNEKYALAYASLQQGLKYVNEEYSNCALVLLCLLKYEVWTPYATLAKEGKILPALKEDLALIRKLKDDKKVKKIFKTWGLDMEELCSNLISNYVVEIDAREHPKGPTEEQLELARIRQELERLTVETRTEVIGSMPGIDVSGI